MRGRAVSDRSVPGPVVAPDVRVLVAHHFALPRISGLTVTAAELVRLIPEVHAGTTSGSVSYEETAEPEALVALLDRDHADATCVVGLNLHIEVGWEHTLALAAWCRRRAIPLVLYVHDYWPHHREGVAVLTSSFAAALVAITPPIVADLAADGFDARLLAAGIAVPDTAAPAAPALSLQAKTVAAVGRLVPRKRFADVVAGFCLAGTRTGATLYLRVPPSLVFSADRDRSELDTIRSELSGCPARAAVRIDAHGSTGTDYRSWALYVSASEYEGVSMTPLEALLQGCPCVLSDIPPHRAIVDALFPGRGEEFLFPVGDRAALAALLTDELEIGRRREEVARRRRQIHDTIDRRWSLRSTARELVRLARAGGAELAGGRPAAGRGGRR